MSLRFALLGLLAVEPASGYDLKRAINRSTYFIWNATGPQIYSTLHKLREEGCITSRSLAQDGKPDKQIHTITAQGRTRLEEFMSEPIHASVTRDEVLLRIFFGNFAGKKAIRRELGSSCSAYVTSALTWRRPKPASTRTPAVSTRRGASSSCRFASRSRNTGPWSKNWCDFLAPAPARRNRRNNSRAAAQIRAEYSSSPVPQAR